MKLFACKIEAADSYADITMKIILIPESERFFHDQILILSLKNEELDMARSMRGKP